MSEGLRYIPPPEKKFPTSHDENAPRDSQPLSDGPDQSASVKKDSPGVIRKLAARRDVRLAPILAAALAVADTTGCRDEKSEISETMRVALKEKGSLLEKLPPVKETVFDNHPEFFRDYPRGEFPRDEREKRLKKYPNNITLFEDIGLTFYVVRPGDTKSEIAQRLIRLDPERFGHLADQKEKLVSFNIPDKELRPGMFLPIPLENKNRHLTDEQFLTYAHKAVEEMLSHPKYGKHVKRVIEKISFNELLISMLAFAKQESGGKPLGQFEFHRWEPGKKKVFSYSLFHILMDRKWIGRTLIEGPGLKARRVLNRTEGQLYHPINACKVYLAFLVEKCLEKEMNLESLFPITENREEFARFYNGKYWPHKNPDYVLNLVKYYGHAVKKIGDIMEVDVSQALGLNEKILQTEQEKYLRRLAEIRHRSKKGRAKVKLEKTDNTKSPQRMRVNGKNAPPSRIRRRGIM